MFQAEVLNGNTTMLVSLKRFSYIFKLVKIYYWTDYTIIILQVLYPGAVCN